MTTIVPVSVRVTRLPKPKGHFRVPRRLSSVVAAAKRTSPAGTVKAVPTLKVLIQNQTGSDFAVDFSVTSLPALLGSKDRAANIVIGDRSVYLGREA